MSLLTRTEALERAQSLSVDTVAVDLDLTGAATGEETFGATSTFELSVSAASLRIDCAGEVKEVTVDGEAWDYERGENFVRLDGLAEGTHTVRVDARNRYSTNGQGLHRYVDPEDGRVYCYTHFEPMDAHTAWPCFDQPDLKARWTFRVSAPAHWVVRSNQPLTLTEDVGEGRVRWSFAQTPPLSSYLACVIAGEYAQVRGTTWREPSEGEADGESDGIEMTFLCRQALSGDLDVEDIERVTHAGLTFFHDRYQFAYPWGKYDQVFVPEYNIGAMENPGLVTFNEHFIRRGGPTRASRQALAGIILHEMCHMWFGDLVTPKWWDDLWLKESFADHEGTEALTTATEYATGWSDFTLAREGWAHVEDQLPTTHPILATIDDVEAAKQNFDGITYAKGACVLRQLVTWVGPEAFVEAIRGYFRDHAFSSATFGDLIGALTRASGRDVEAWSRAWLATSCPSIVTVSDSTITQQAHPSDSAATLRPHRLSVATLDSDGDALRLGPVQEVELTASGEPVTVDLQAPLVANVTGSTYALVRQDRRTWDLALDRLATLPDPQARAVVWLSLIDGARDGHVSVADVLARGLRQADAEDPALRPTAIRGLAGLLAFVPRSMHERVVHPLVGEVLGFLHGADRARLDAWVGFLSLLVAYPGTSDDEIGQVNELLVNPSVSTDRRWDLVAALAATGNWDGDDIDAFHRAHDPSGRGAMRALAAHSALPGVEAWVRRRLWEDLEATNEQVDAWVSGLKQPSRRSDRDAGDYVSRICDAWQARPLHMAIKVAEGAFPSLVDVADGGVEDHPVVVAISELCDRHDLPAALRRVLEQRLDHVRRRLARQAETARAAGPTA